MTHDEIYLCHKQYSLVVTVSLIHKQGNFPAKVEAIRLTYVGRMKQIAILERQTKERRFVTIRNLASIKLRL